jgi:hypothetical protein
MRSRMSFLRSFNRSWIVSARWLAR